MAVLVFDAFNPMDLMVLQDWFCRCRSLNIGSLALARNQINTTVLPGYPAVRVRNAKTAMLILQRAGVKTVEAASERINFALVDSRQRWKVLNKGEKYPSAIRYRNAQTQARKQAAKEFRNSPFCPDCEHHKNPRYRAKIKMRRSKFMPNAWTCPRCHLSQLRGK